MPILEYQVIKPTTIEFHHKIKGTRVTRQNGKKLKMIDIKRLVQGIEETDPSIEVLVRGGTIDNQFKTLKGYREGEILDDEEYMSERVRDPEQFMEFFYVDIYVKKPIETSIFNLL